MGIHALLPAMLKLMLAMGDQLPGSVFDSFPSIERKNTRFKDYLAHYKTTRFKCAL